MIDCTCFIDYGSFMAFKTEKKSCLPAMPKVKYLSTAKEWNIAMRAGKVTGCQESVKLLRGKLKDHYDSLSVKEILHIAKWIKIKQAKVDKGFL